MSIKGIACIKKLINIRYKRKFPSSDLRDMETIKHVAKTIGLATLVKLNKEKNIATVKTIRNKMQKLMSQWKRETILFIPS